MQSFQGVRQGSRGGTAALPYMQACLMEDDGPLQEAMAASPYAIGNATFVESTEARIEERRSGRVQDRDLDLPRWTVGLDDIDAVVARHYTVDPDLLKTHGHHAGGLFGLNQRTIVFSTACFRLE